MTHIHALDRTQSADFLSTFEAFKAANDERLAELERKQSADVLVTEKIERIDQALHRQKAALDRLALDRARPGVSAEALTSPSERKTAFDRYLRRGDAAGLLERKDLSSGTGADGGYVVNAELEAAIARRLEVSSPMRAIASVRQISAGTYKKPISITAAGASWAAETGTRAGTTEPTLDLLAFPAAELFALPAATQALLDDSFVDLDQWIASEVEDAFASAETTAFLTGDGSAKPKGFLDYTKKADATAAWGEIGYVATGATDAFGGDPIDNLIDLVYAPKSRYRAEARFVMNRRTLSTVRKFKDADGNYIWQPAGVSGQLSSLLGYPVTEIEEMPNIAANAYAIAFGDFRRSYLIVDRAGVQVLRDPYKAKPFVLFYTTKRVGGGVQDFDAIKLLKFAAS